MTKDVSRWKASNSCDWTSRSERRAVTIAPAACSVTVSMNSRSSIVYETPVRSGPITRNPVSLSFQRSGTIVDPSVKTLANSGAIHRETSEPSTLRGFRVVVRSPTSGWSGATGSREHPVPAAYAAR